MAPNSGQYRWGLLRQYHIKSPNLKTNLRLAGAASFAEDVMQPTSVVVRHHVGVLACFFRYLQSKLGTNDLVANRVVKVGDDSMELPKI